ncbi:hypothetical protein SAV14893_083880 [Streptomyces avermitilis]|uniref:Uncharacterized protein n=1 Tax=Streptomyces avermitilis TaxID=33903 RepID=A0A4D4MF86_STRAX|nr:hypothetical protein SAVMC3_01090 [Streptomyces avermitilis]GDY68995.1 hypothetical protein SAV14893_083880 [Streptomyces avermitilis]GDY70623.1 hypothetical protein SAV31267_001080 [Streptomyces avermitilis]
MTLARAVPALIDRDDPIPGNQPRGHHLPLTRMTGQAVQQHDRLPRPAPVPADKPNPVAPHHTLGPHHDRPQESSRPIMPRQPRAALKAALLEGAPP